MRWPRSIRARLALISAVVILAVLLVAGIGLVLLFETYIERRVGQELRGRVLDLAGAVTLDARGNPALTRLPSDPRYRSPYSGVYWYVREGEVVVLRSRSLWDGDIGWGADTPPTPVMRDATGPDGGGVFLLERAVSLGSGAGERHFLLGVALDKAEVDELASSFNAELAAGLGLIGLLLFAGAWLQASYGLEPLNSIRRKLVSLHEGRSERLEGPFPEEIEPLAQDLNTLFARQKEMIAKARERAGMLAHGLKTPMTVLHGEARKLARDGRSGDAAFIGGQLDLMQRQLDRELSRARSHGAAIGLGLHADVTATAHRLIVLMQRMPRGDHLVWTTHGGEARVAMDSDDLGEVLGNLLDNARQWAKASVAVRVAELEPGRILVTVTDDGPGLPGHVRSADLRRGGVQPSSQGSGLGLAIVADILAGYDAFLDIDNLKDGGAALSFMVRGSLQPEAAEAVPAGGPRPTLA